MNLLDGYKIYKDVQGKEYHSVPDDTKEKLKQFRKDLGVFTDKIFNSRGLVSARNGKGMWQNSGNFTKYMWNRYKLKDDLNSNLVIYFNASTVNSEGLFISIGLIDDRLNEFEKNNSIQIYEFLEEKCKNVICNDFKRHNTGWGERVFTVVDENNYENVDYDCILTQLKEVYQQAINKFYIKKNSKEKDNQDMKQPLNKILYGPPGTGKTYNTIDQALQIIDGTVPDNREEVKERFEDLKEAGQIKFVTFHQSYGYEEFVEGIKAIPSGKEGNDSDEMIYDVISGIFRKISKEALINYSANSTDILEAKSFELNAKSLNIQAKMIQDDESTYRVLKGSKIRKEQAPSFSQYNYSTLRDTVLKKAKLKEESEFYILQEDYNFQSMSAASSIILGRMSNGLRDWKEMINYDVSVKNNKNYILIIDEINRGNISKIFGELITLIEDSKRLGEDEAVEITLPYSGESFGVPNNLYILGTMNTADRSIALMDTALRRRFEFEEMMPKPELLSDDVEGIDLQRLLSKINLRIEYLYDRDHTIGHAYFIDVKDKIGLDSAMKNKVIPLLQEYFYDDWEKIRLVLNDGFISKTEQKPNDIFDSIDDEFVDEEKYSYDIVDYFSKEAYRKIYE